MDPSLGSRAQGPSSRSAMGRISGRILVHARAEDFPKIADLIDPECSGLILTRSRRNRAASFARTLMDFRRQHPDIPVLVDAGAYEDTDATVNSPFELHEDLFGGNLSDHLNEQRNQGSPIAITPTRFIPYGAVDVLREVLTQTDELCRNDTLCLLPLSYQWFDADHLKFLAYELRRVAIPVALILANSTDPMRTRYVRRGLRELMTEDSGLSLLRTDLTAFEVTTRGRGFASVGVRSSMRHLNRRGFIPKQADGAHDTTPHVLVPELLRWFKGSVISRASRAGLPVGCDCPVCHGDDLGRFGATASATKSAAELHAIATWMPWARELFDIHDRSHRRRWWQAKSAGAMQRGLRWSSEYGIEFGDFAVVKFWSQD